MLARRLHLSAAPALRRLSTKSSTGIVGMEVRPDAPEILLSLYSKTLAELESLPAEAGYRSAVEALTKGRMAAVEGAKSIEEIETAIGGGQVEQLIQQAEHELQLIPTMRDARVGGGAESAILAEELYTDLKRRGVALQRADVSCSSRKTTRRRRRSTSSRRSSRARRQVGRRRARPVQ